MTVERPSSEEVDWVLDRLEERFVPAPSGPDATADQVVPAPRR